MRSGTQELHSSPYWYKSRKKQTKMEPRPDDRFVIAKRFKALRRKAHLSQLRLAEIIGVCRQSVNEVENCRVLLHYSTWENFHNLESKHRLGQEVRLPVRWS
jgi:DNA-binding XRE family transcriptional regulator